LKRLWWVGVACVAFGCGGSTEDSESANSTSSPDVDAGGRDVSPDLPSDLGRDGVDDQSATPDLGAGDVDPVPDGSQTDTGPDPPMLLPFQEGAGGVNFRDLAGDFTVTTTEGDWSFRENWTGRDSYIFTQYTSDTRNSADLLNFLNQLWFDSGDPVDEWVNVLRDSPPNVHYFLTSFDQGAPTQMATYKTHIDAALARLTDEERDHWSPRVHLVTTPIWNTTGWLNQAIRHRSWLWFGIDSEQRYRQLGTPVDFLADRPRLLAFVQELKYFEFEFQRRQELLADANTVTVETLRSERFSNKVFEFDLPEASVLAEYDQLTVDIGMYCTDHLDENCGAWDRLAHFDVCDEPRVEGNAHDQTACQPHVAGVTEVVEAMGTCAGTMDACRDDMECAAGVGCENYVAPLDGVVEVPADTIACRCTKPYGGEVDAVYRCKDDGLGYADCNCGCGNEIARWITTYGREGRWVTDISPMLPMLQGGTQRFRLRLSNTYDVDLDLRLSKSGDDLRASEMTPLWRGKGFNENYNTDREAVTFEVPDGVKRVEVVALITGHGWGVEQENCAEFCNHTHHFSVNGTEFVKEHPAADQVDGCYQRVDEGVVPNQPGSWPFGRAGWCPGLDVQPWRVDITENLVSGTNTITYRGLFRGVNYVPQPATTANNGGFPGNINMSSYLVFWR
jgi:hypothetical protein